MDQFVYRAALLICMALSLGVLANVFMFQGTQPRLAMSRPVKPAPVEARVRTSERPQAEPAASAPLGSHVASPDLIRAIQRELNASGFASRAPDGALDMSTRAAILAWERENGLPLTADASEEVLKALLLGAGTVRRTPATAPAPAVALLVRHIQILLKSHGNAAVLVNGRHDEPTRTAIRAFQRQQSMPADGNITATLVIRLEATGLHGR